MLINTRGWGTCLVGSRRPRFFSLYSLSFSLYLSLSLLRCERNTPKKTIRKRKANANRSGRSKKKPALQGQSASFRFGFSTNVSRKENDDDRKKKQREVKVSLETAEEFLDDRKGQRPKATREERGLHRLPWQRGGDQSESTLGAGMTAPPANRRFGTEIPTPKGKKVTREERGLHRLPWQRGGDQSESTLGAGMTAPPANRRFGTEIPTPKGQYRLGVRAYGVCVRVAVVKKKETKEKKGRKQKKKTKRTCLVGSRRTRRLRFSLRALFGFSSAAPTQTEIGKKNNKKSKKNNSIKDQTGRLGTTQMMNEPMLEIFGTSDEKNSVTSFTPKFSKK